MKTTFSITILVIIFIAIFFTGYFIGNNRQSEPEISFKSDTIIKKSDTLIIRDTIRIDKPKYVYKQTVRIDTIAIIDTISVTVPIEQKTYQSDDYYAIIEGYKASILSMSVYPKTYIIKDTIQINSIKTTKTSPRLAFSVGFGVGYTGTKIEPYMGLHFGYILWSK